VLFRSYPAPTDSFQFAYAYAAPKILGDDVTQTPGTVLQQDWDWFLDSMTARVKTIEGRILRRYQGIPGAQVPLVTDGEQLVAEGERDWSAALEDLMLRTPELPFRKSGSSPAELPLGF
jgi:hypothetical protein